MWNRADLKKRAKERFKANYWLTVVASLILMLVTGGGSSGGSSVSYSNSSPGVVSDWIDDMDDEFSRDSYEEWEGQFVEDSGELTDKGAIGILVIAGIVIVIVLTAVVIAACLDIFLLNPLYVGCQRFFVKNLKEKASLAELGILFSSNYKNGVKTMFLKELYTFLWTLLFIIPGIVKSYEYRMIPYLLAVNPEMGTEEAFSRSKAMMDGNKWNAFVLDLSFMGWHILSVFTLGILSIFYVNPYVYQTDAALFEALNGGNGFEKIQSYGNDVYGNDAYGNDAYGNDAYGNDAYGNDTYVEM